MVLPAPGLFSTITVWPSFYCRPGCSRRATMSDEPPGANVTTILIGLAGQAWACTVAAAKGSKALAARRMRRVGFMAGFLQGWRRWGEMKGGRGRRAGPRGPAVRA